MALSDLNELIKTSRKSNFVFYQDIGDTATSGLVNIAPGVPFGVTDIILQLSAAYSLSAQLVLRLSTAEGARYHYTFYSTQFSNSTEFIWTASVSRVFLSDDVLVLSLPLTSGAILGGVRVEGWAVDN